MTSRTAAAAAFGLPTTLRLPDAPLGNDEFEWMDARRVRHHKVVGVATPDGVFPVAPAQREAVDERWTMWLAHALRLERLVLEFTEVLGAHDIQGIVLKGAGLEHA